MKTWNISSLLAAIKTVLSTRSLLPRTLSGVRSRFDGQWCRRLRSLLCVMLGIVLVLLSQIPMAIAQDTLAQNAQEQRILAQTSVAQNDDLLANDRAAPVRDARDRIRNRNRRRDENQNENRNENRNENQNPTAPINNTSELRGVWLTNIDSNVLFSKSNLENAVRRLERLNFNTLYPTVWNGGYTLYPSEVAEDTFGVKVDPHPGFEDRDMLKEAIDQGHKRNMAVIPWFEYGLMAPADSELARAHPEWLTQKRDGSKVVRMHNENLVWLNPAHPEVQKFLVDLIRETVTEYNVDGIQLDDHFGMPVDMGYDDYTIELYKREHNGRRPPNNPKDALWMRWRARRVNDLMSKIYVAVKSEKPRSIVSLSPNPREFAYETSLQDWFSWARLGLLDEVIVQVYRNDFSRFTYELNQLNRPDVSILRRRVPISIGILTGLRVMNVDISQVERQVRTARDRRFSGVAFFFYESLGDRDAAFQAMFPEPVVRPDRRSLSATGQSN